MSSAQATIASPGRLAARSKKSRSVPWGGVLIRLPAGGKASGAFPAMPSAMKIRLKRVYEPRSNADGVRILVERLWPRGMTKETAGVDIWMREVSPSPPLRKWYGHDPEKWPEFQRRYQTELAANGEAIRALCEHCAKGATFLYAAKDEVRNSAAVLKVYIERTARS